jgi:hypothetical protein
LPKSPWVHLSPLQLQTHLKIVGSSRVWHPLHIYPPPTGFFGWVGSSKNPEKTHFWVIINDIYFFYKKSSFFLST